MVEVRREIPEAFRKWEQKAENLKEGVEVAKEVWLRILSVKANMKKWESEKHKSWEMSPEGFKGRVATDGSLLGTAGKWRACGWSVVQLDYDEELGPLHGMYGSMEAKFEVQRTMKRVELTAFLGLLKKVTGPIKVYVDNKGVIVGLWRGERKCVDPKAGVADLSTNLGRIAGAKVN